MICLAFDFTLFGHDMKVWASSILGDIHDYFNQENQGYVI
jgi:hypothetical protein